MVGQEASDPAAVAWSLQGFTVLGVDIDEAPTRGEPGRRVKVVLLDDVRGVHICPQCRARHAEGIFQETEPRRWRDCSLGDYETYVELVPWRVACCGGTRVEWLPFEAPRHRMTRRFFERVAALCTRMPISVVAEMVGLSWDTVARIDKTAIEMALGGEAPSLDGLRWIGVDEVSRTGGHVYFTVVTDLASGRVVWIADGKREAALNAFFAALGPQRCRRIEVVVSDLGGGYLASIARHIPTARHVLDRFHIVQWLNEAVNEVRRGLFGASPRMEEGRTIKAKKWMLLRARERLDMAHRRMLSRLMTLNRPLYRAYLLKEQLRAILAHPWRYIGALERNLFEWCDAAIRSRLPEMAVVARRILVHTDKVVAGFGCGVKLGLVEANNGKIALLRREARGFRDPLYFKLKIFQRCSLPANPFARCIL
jgi:transposase